MALSVKEEINILDSKKIQLYRDKFNTLKLRIEGEAKEYSEVRPLAAFPLSDTEHYISLTTEDGKEIGIIQNPGELDPESQKVLAEELAKVYFLPRILKINKIKEEYGVTRWEVETDRGPRAFDVRSRHDVRLLGGRRVIIKDVDGNRFEIPDYGKLDPKSMSLLDSEI